MSIFSAALKSGDSIIDALNAAARSSGVSHSIPAQFGAPMRSRPGSPRQWISSLFNDMPFVNRQQSEIFRLPHPGRAGSLELDDVPMFPTGVGPIPSFARSSGVGSVSASNLRGLGWGGGLRPSASLIPPTGPPNGPPPITNPFASFSSAGPPGSAPSAASPWASYSGGGPPKPPKPPGGGGPVGGAGGVGGAADDVIEAATGSKASRLRGLGKSAGKLGLGLGGAALLYSALTGEDEDPVVPDQSALLPPGAFMGMDGAGSTRTSTTTGAQIGAGRGPAQQALIDHYNDLMQQASDASESRTQQLNEIYGQQRGYNSQLLQQMESANQAHEPAHQQLLRDMEEDYALSNQGMPGVGHAESQGTINDIEARGRREAAAQSDMVASTGGSLDDLLRAGVQSNNLRQQELQEGVMNQAAEDERTLRNQYLDTAMQSELDYQNQLAIAQVQSQLTREETAATPETVPQNERYKYVAGVESMLAAEGEEIVLPPEGHQAIQAFLMDGNPGWLNYVLYLAKNTPA